jgi:hypothetical protein
VRDESGKGQEAALCPLLPVCSLCFSLLLVACLPVCLLMAAAVWLDRLLAGSAAARSGFLHAEQLNVAVVVVSQFI